MDPRVLEGMLGMTPRQQMQLLKSNKSNPDSLALVLENVCTTLVMGFEEYLHGFDPSRGLAQFIEIGQKHLNGSGDIATLALRAIALVLEHVPNSNDVARENPQIMRTAVGILRTARSLQYAASTVANCVEEALRVVNFVATEDSLGMVAASGIISTVVEVSKYLDSRSIKLCLDTLTGVCRKMLFSASQAGAGGQEKKVAQALKGSKLPDEVAKCLIPHVHTVLDNALATAAAGDQWSIIEAAARCCGVVVGRLTAGAPHLVPHLVTTTLVTNLVVAAHSVAQLDAKKIEMLHVLVLLAKAAPEVVAAQLHSSPASTFFNDLFRNDSVDDVSMMLKDPFGKFARSGPGNRLGGSSLTPNASPQRNQQQGAGGSSSSLVLLLALQLLSSCSDPLPSDALCVPFTVLPIHKWSWEDDVHSYNEYSHTQAIAIERARFAGEATAQINAGGSTYTINFQSMKQSRGERSRNVRRADIPSSFEVLLLQPPASGDSAGVVPCHIGDAPFARKLRHGPQLLSAFAPLLIRGSSGASVCNGITEQCALVLAQLLHACLPADDAYIAIMTDTVGGLLCDFVSGQLLSSSAPSEAVDVGLLLCDWMFHHRGHEWGLQLHSKRVALVDRLAEVAENHPEPISARAHELHEIIASSESPAATSPTLRGTPLGAALSLFANASGEFQDTYLSELLQNLTEARQLTSSEFEGLGVAQTLLRYLTRAPPERRPTPTHLNPAVGHSSIPSTPPSSPDRRLCESFSGTAARSPSTPATPGSPDIVAPREAPSSPSTPQRDSSSSPPSPNPLHDAPADPTRVRHFVAAISKNAGCCEVLVRHLMGVLATHHRTEPDVESLTTQRSVSCRSVPDALNVLAAMSPVCELCTKRPKDEVGMTREQQLAQPPKLELKSQDTCPNGHRLLAHRSHSWVCDVCGSHGTESMACRECDFDICMDCFNDPATSGYAGAPYTGPPLMPVLPGSKTHILATVGDLERAFSGCSRGRSRSSGRAAGSALDELRQEFEGMLSLAGHGSSLPERLHDLIMRRMQMLEAEESRNSGDDGASPERGPVRDKARLELFYEGVGRVSLHEPLFTVLYRKAFSRKIFTALETLETGIMMVDTAGAGGSKKRAKGVAGASPSSRHLKELSDSSPTRLRTLYFHVFEDDEAVRCACGEMQRADANRERGPLLQRRPCAVSQRPEFTLLHLLHQVNERHGEVLVPTKLFHDSELTAKLLRSVNASALRVALLPLDLALPRWATNLLFEYTFIVPHGVRVKIVEFALFGARKSLWEAVRQMGHPSLTHSGFDVMPYEWTLRGSHLTPSRRQQQLNKFTVSRDTIAADAHRLLTDGAELRLPVVIEISGDAGTGVGPTVQFFSMVATELCKQKHRLWRCDSAHLVEGNDADDALITEPVEGLFPLPRSPADAVPQSTLDLMSLAGMALARSLLDGRVFPLPLSPMMFVYLRAVRSVPGCFAAHVPPEQLRVDHVDRALSKVLDDCVHLGIEYRLAPAGEPGDEVRESIEQKFRDMDLCFTLPGNETISLVPDSSSGVDVAVRPSNVQQFSQAVTAMLLVRSVRGAVAAFLRGFMDVLPTSPLGILSPTELQQFMCGIGPSTGPLWTAAEMLQCVVASHGYSKDSPQLAMLVEVISTDFSPSQQSAFLAFCTGCPRLPIGGLRAMGHITVVRKELPAVSDTSGSPAGGSPAGGAATATAAGFSRGAATSDGSPTVSDVGTPSEERTSAASFAATLDLGLPSVNTCFKYLKLPPYPTKELLREKLLLAIEESGDLFELS